MNHLAQTSPEPMMLEILRAEGHYLYDLENKPYLDLISGISVSSLGHQHPEIVQAIKNQADKHLHLMVYGELVQSPQTQLAQRLSEILPEQLNSFYFLNSGTEATEAAMKLAKRLTGKQGFVSQTKAYHGSTQGALSLMSDEYFTASYRPLIPDVSYIEQNDIAAISIPPNTAAVIIELVQAEKGCIPGDKEYVKQLRNLCTEKGVLLIVDEIQTGMGRTGSMFFFEQYGIIPDILLLGKALGGGMPMGAMVTSKEKMQGFANNPILGHITTFGGHPVSCAAALAAVNLTVSNFSSFNVAEKGEMFKNLLKHPEIKEVTGAGLLLAVHLESFEKTREVIMKGLEKGVCSDWFLFAPHCLRIAPPLSISEEEIEHSCRVILESL